MTKIEEQELDEHIKVVIDDLIRNEHRHIKNKTIRNFRIALSKFLNKNGISFFWWCGRIEICLFHRRILILYKFMDTVTIDDILSEIKEGRKISALKLYRTWASNMHLGAYECKLAVERLEKEYCKGENYEIL